MSETTHTPSSTDLTSAQQLPLWPSSSGAPNLRLSSDDLAGLDVFSPDELEDVLDLAGSSAGGSRGDTIGGQSPAPSEQPIPASLALVPYGSQTNVAARPIIFEHPVPTSTVRAGNPDGDTTLIRARYREPTVTTADQIVTVSRPPAEWREGSLEPAIAQQSEYAESWRERLNDAAGERLRLLRQALGTIALYRDVVVEHGPRKGGHAVWMHFLERNDPENESAFWLVNEVQQTRNEYKAAHPDRRPIVETVFRAIGVISMMTQRHAQIRLQELRAAARPCVPAALRRALHTVADQAIRGFQGGRQSNATVWQQTQSVTERTPGDS